MERLSFSFIDKYNKLVNDHEISYRTYKKTEKNYKELKNLRDELSEYIQFRKNYRKGCKHE